MQISRKGALEIAEHEGIVPAPYFDSVGVKTWGVGHTKNAGGLDPANMQLAMPEGANLDREIDRALAIFQDDLGKYAARVNKAFPIPMKQYEFDALVSMDFNTGMASWRSPTGQPAAVVRYMNAGDKARAARAFMGWLRPPELRKRRTAEMNLFQTGNYDANGDSIPVWGTNGNGKLTGIVRTIKGRDVLKKMGQAKPRQTGDASFNVGAMGAIMFAAIAALIAFGKDIINAIGGLF